MANPREKGKEGERELRILLEQGLRGVLPDLKIQRNHQQAEVGGDDLVGVPYFSVEVKRRKKLPGAKELESWWAQACKQATAAGKEPCLIYREDFGQWKVMLWMRLHDAGGWCTGTVVLEQFIDYLCGRIRRHGKGGAS